MNEFVFNSWFSTRLMADKKEKCKNLVSVLKSLNLIAQLILQNDYIEVF